MTLICWNCAKPQSRLRKQHMWNIISIDRSGQKHHLVKKSEHVKHTESINGNCRKAPSGEKSEHVNHTESINSNCRKVPSGWTIRTYETNAREYRNILVQNQSAVTTQNEKKKRNGQISTIQYKIQYQSAEAVQKLKVSEQLSTYNNTIPVGGNCINT